MSRVALGGGAKLEVEALSLELEGGESAEVAIAEGDEGRQQHDCVWREVVWLDSIEGEEGAEEAARRKAEA